ncbi:hypothetical protein Tco_1325684, partial [Tanacetum coccineum]
GMLDLGLHLYASSTTSMVGYTDVDWAGCPSTRRLPHPGQGILDPTPAIYASQATTLPSAFSTMSLQDPTWHMDTGASSHLNFNASNLSTIFDKRLFPSVHVGDGKSIPVTNTCHNIITSHHRPLHLHNVLVTSNIIKNLIYVHHFTRDNACTIEFDAFGFSVKDYLTRHILLRCDSSDDLYPVTNPSTSPTAFLSTSSFTWNQRLGYPSDQNTMAEQNVPAQPPTRTDEQIISVDILSNTNFFQAFTASANVPAIYLQQFWKTMSYNEKTGVYSCQVDEQWFDLSADLLRKALAITPVIPAQPFELPPSGNTVIDFVNELGYPEPVEIVSNIRVNYVYQPWRAILTIINQCLTGKTSGSDKPRHPVLQML